MQKYIYKLSKAGEEISFTTLSDLLKSEGMIRIYGTVSRAVRLKNIFTLGDIQIKKIKLVHTKYRK